MPASPSFQRSARPRTSIRRRKPGSRRSAAGGSSCLAIVLIIAGSTVAPPADAGQQPAPTPILQGSDLLFEPTISAERWRLLVSGPDDFYIRREFSGAGLTLSLVGEDGAPPSEGSYFWELRALDRARFAPGAVAAGSFRVHSGAVLLPDGKRPESMAPAQSSTGGIPPEAADSSGLPAALVPDHVGPFYIDGPLAFGIEIDGTEPTGFLSMLVEEDNIRLVFRDTSITPSFPTNDWQVTLNDSSNGGADYFGIEDLTATSMPFRIDGGAGTDSIRVDQNGRVGIGLSAPATLLHVDGDTTLDGDLAILSSKTAKQDLVPVDAPTVLARVDRLPLLEWSYLGHGDVRHLGPTAEEFHAAFHLGRDDRTISPLDLAGVALAAIQGLRAEVAALAEQEASSRRRLADQEREISRLESERALLRRRLDTLESTVRDLTNAAPVKKRGDSHRIPAALGER